MINLSQLAPDVQLIGLSALAAFLCSVLLYLLFIKPVQKYFLVRELRKRQDTFVALSSHYLITPISIIQSAIVRLQEEDSKLTLEQRQKMYEAIRSGQQRLFVLTEQFLVAGDISGGGLHLRSEVANLGDVVGDATAMVDPFAREKGITITVKQDKELGDIHLDIRLIKQAIAAVLDNAIKFSQPESRVEVEISFASGVFRITVNDEGIGMPKEVIDHLSEGFYRGSDIYNFDYEGIGLGLHIAQAIIAAHQGSLSVASQPKKGTSVRVELPGY